MTSGGPGLTGRCVIDNDNRHQGWRQMRTMLITASLLLAGALCFGSARAADPGITDTEILIGDVEPLTGPPALLGVAAPIGPQIAIAEANNAGGINRRKIKNVL